MTGALFFDAEKLFIPQREKLIFCKNMPKDWLPSFVDTSSRGSQTGESTIDNKLPLPSSGMANSRQTAVNADRRPPLAGPTNKGKRYSPIRSRLASGKWVLKVPKSGNNRQGRVPWSNIAFNPPPYIQNRRNFVLTISLLRPFPNHTITLKNTTTVYR